MEGLTLIGMPTAGKSTIGRKLATELGYTFVDLDQIITERQGKSYHEVLRCLGDQYFLEIEEQYAMELEFHDTVFAPGGSIVYCPKAMEKICDESHVVYLRTNIETIRERLSDALQQRGIVGAHNKTLEQLYDERSGLYCHYADTVIDTVALSEAEIVGIVKKAVFMITS